MDFVIFVSFFLTAKKLKRGEKDGLVSNKTKQTKPTN